MSELHADPHGGFWTALTPDVRDRIRAQGRTVAFARGDHVLREGDLSTHLLLILRGQAKIVKGMANGTQAILAIRRSGDLVGELAALSDESRSAGVVAIEPLHALHLAGSRFRALVETDATAAGALMRQLVHRLHQADRRPANFSGPARQRLAALLIDLATAEGRQIERNSTIEMPLSQQEQAECTATSRESVVRAYQSLREQRIIGTRQRTVTVIRPVALYAVAGGHSITGDDPSEET